MVVLTCLLLLLMSYSIFTNDTHYERVYTGSVGFNVTEYECERNPYICNGSVHRMSEEEIKNVGIYLQ